MSTGGGGAAAGHVLMVEPVEFRSNPETVATNAFQAQPESEGEEALGGVAVEQHRALRDLLIANGVYVTVARSTPATPDAPFCNNWFSTHQALGSAPAALVLYPLMAPSRRLERRPDLVRFLRGAYGRVIDLAGCEREGRFLESTGSLVLDHSARVAYAALSPRTDRSMAQHWADTVGFRLVTFTATDAQGMPYYHTNVMLFIGHGLAGVCLESIADPGERHEVEISLVESRLELLPISREQVTHYCGNCLALSNDLGERLFVMSTAAYEGFTPAQRSTLESHGRLLYSDLSVFERLGGGSARCLLGELF